MIGSVKSIIRSAFPSTGTSTVSNHSGCGDARSVLCVGEKVNLMNVERVDLVRIIHDAPVVKSADGDARHGRVRRAVFLAVDIEAILVFSERNHKIRRAILHPRNQLGRHRLVNRGRQSGPSGMVCMSWVAWRLSCPPAPLPGLDLHQGPYHSNAYVAMRGLWMMAR